MNPAPPNDWYYVYLLNSSKTSSTYVGCTDDLGGRLKEHNGDKEETKGGVRKRAVHRLGGRAG
jgi:predicted GIY-YIG superfamily endonuclease